MLALRKGRDANPNEARTYFSLGRLLPETLVESIAGSFETALTPSNLDMNTSPRACVGCAATWAARRIKTRPRSSTTRSAELRPHRRSRQGCFLQGNEFFTQLESGSL